MRKKLLSITLTLLSIIFMVSCVSDEPFSGSNSNIATKENTWLYDSIFVRNYLWDVNSSPNLSLDTETFFNSLLNENDKVSKITKTQAATPTYSIGFTYGANYYNVDKKLYYVVYYVDPGSQAETDGLKRGYIITKVNDTEITEQNVQTLLEDAYKDGNLVTLLYLIPPSSKPESIKITPKVATPQNPIYNIKGVDTQDINDLGSGKIMGYMLYNSFTSGTKENPYIYDDAVAEKMQEFVNAGVNYLVLDLRYNPGGNILSSVALASGIIKNRIPKENFILFVRDRKTSINVVPLNPITLTEETRGGASIPSLGNQLKGIYIITGVYTAGLSEAFINAIKPYGNDIPIKIYGQKGEFPADADPTIATQSTESNGQTTILAIAHIANKNGQYNYANGFTPDKEVFDVYDNSNEMLKPLGNLSEAILYQVFLDIVGISSTKSTSNNEGAKSIYSPIMNQPWANRSILNSEDIK